MPNNHLAGKARKAKRFHRFQIPNCAFEDHAPAAQRHVNAGLHFAPDCARRWSRIDILPLIALLFGIGLQVKSFADLLARDSLLVTNYDRSMRLFLIGLLVIAIGIVIALANDVLGWSQQKLFG